MGKATSRMRRKLQSKLLSGMFSAQVENMSHLVDVLSVEVQPQESPNNRTPYPERITTERSGDGEYPRTDYGDSIRNLQANGVRSNTTGTAVAIGFNTDPTGNGTEDDGATGVLRLWDVIPGGPYDYQYYDRKTPTDAFIENIEQLRAAFMAGAKSGSLF